MLKGGRWQMRPSCWPVRLAVPMGQRGRAPVTREAWRRDPVRTLPAMRQTRARARC